MHRFRLFSSFSLVRCLRCGILCGVLGAVALFAGFSLPAAPANLRLCRAEDLTTAPDAAFAATGTVPAGVIDADGGPVPNNPNATPFPAQKRVCLTFDDGPSKNTESILATLEEKNVPATFFVISAENNLEYLPLVQREVADGCEIGLHSCSHDYQKIYSSTTGYWDDIDALRRSLSAYIDVSSVTCLRFPGGSTNTVSHKYGGSGIMKELKTQAEERGYHCVDWNVCAEDAAGGHPSAHEIYKNVTNGAEDLTTCVVLMHDTKVTTNTAEALPDIIDWFSEHGFQFCTTGELYA